MNNIWIFVVLLFLFQSCASIAPFDKEKPIEIESGFLSNSFKQDGKHFDASEMIDHISKKNPEKNIKLKFYSMLIPTSILSGVGGWLIGDSLVTYDDETEEGESEKLRNGAIMAGVAILLFSPLINKYLTNRVKEYNKEHFPDNKEKTTSFLTPMIQQKSGETRYLLQNTWMF